MRPFRFFFFLYKKNSNTYCELVALYILSIFLVMILYSRCSCVHFVGEETKKWRGKVIFLRVYHTHNQNSYPGLPDSKNLCLCSFLTLLRPSGNIRWWVGNLLLKYLGKNFTQDYRKRIFNRLIVTWSQYSYHCTESSKFTGKKEMLWIFIFVPLCSVYINYRVEMLLFFFSM